MKKTLIALAISGISMTSMATFAESPSFNFVELGYTQIDIDDVPFDPDGFELDLNFELNENFYLSADYAKVDEMSTELKMSNIGFGFKSDISDSTAFFAQIDWSKIDAGEIDEDGYKVSTGVRSNVTNHLELTAAYEYLDIDDDSSNFFLFGAAYKMSDNVSMYADYKLESDMDQMSVGVRYSF
ncbi:porin [Aliikangiella maris]|uniref:Porin n=2 Tax=Aliikangiella maris TaxID=3162458 RepID=A0ABV2BVI7_9GAMM